MKKIKKYFNNKAHQDFTDLTAHSSGVRWLCVCTFMDKFTRTCRDSGTEKYSYLYTALLYGTANK